jgi:2-polyprenyl-3-methyl-5-hydroxy-6-metoxy-1,4-benzoquinol methylase
MDSNLPKLNDISILKILKQSCYTNNDVRASWIADYNLDTDIVEYKNYATWSHQHWNMYNGFLTDIENKNNHYNILDAACGIGYNTKRLAINLPNSTIMGIDLDKNAISLANKYNNHSNIKYIYGDIFDSSNYNKKFDFIYFLEILEHIKAESHYEIIDKLLSLLNDGGVLFLSTPNELDNKDSTSGHIGLLNRGRTKLFLERYKNNIISGKFYDNSKLHYDNYEYIISDDITTFEDSSWGVGGKSNCKNKSQFKIIMSK